ncbi:MAG: hypothetical protein EZS28_049247, partial [Streblomastix strix]
EFEFDIDPNSTKARKLNLELWDHDSLSDDDQIGYYDLRLKDYINVKKSEQLNFIGVGKHERKQVGLLDYEVEVRSKAEVDKQKAYQANVMKQREIEAENLKKLQADQKKLEQQQEKERKEEEARLAKQKKEEEARLAKERKEEEARLAKQKEIEAANLKKQQLQQEKEKKEEEARLAKQKKEQEEQQKKEEIENAKRLKRRQIEDMQLKQQQQIPEEIDDIGTDVKNVYVKIIGVQNVAAMDSNGKSDPYVKILFDGKQMGRTKKVANTLNAEYNE